MYRNPTRRPAGSNFLQQRGPAPRKGQGRKKKIIGIGSVIVVVGIVIVVAFLHRIEGTPTQGSGGTTAKQQTAGQSTTGTDITTGFNRAQHSLTEPASIWIIVNKQHPLSPKSYAPKDLVVPNVPLRSNITGDERQLRAEPARALEQMMQVAGSMGVHLNLQSGYRSYNFQVNLYGGYVRRQGQAAADRTSARPGYSEHQTGLAADLGGTSKPSCDVEKCYDQTIEGKWLAANAYKYGFLVRYTEDKESVTGYDYEPWHIRYIGTSLATEMHDKNIQTLEEFFGVAGGTSY